MVVYFLFVKSGGRSIDTRQGHKSKEGPEDYTVHIWARDVLQ